MGLRITSATARYSMQQQQRLQQRQRQKSTADLAAGAIRSCQNTHRYTTETHVNSPTLRIVRLRVKCRLHCCYQDISDKTQITSCTVKACLHDDHMECSLFCYLPVFRFKIIFSKKKYYVHLELRSLSWINVIIFSRSSKACSVAAAVACSPFSFVGFKAITSLR